MAVVRVLKKSSFLLSVFFLIANKRCLFSFMRKAVALSVIFQYLVLVFVADLQASPFSNTVNHQDDGSADTVRINAPSSSGLSHNRFEVFNVGKNGIVFNNSLHSGNTAGGERMEANINFTDGAARIILNEVTGGSRSLLEGRVEVFGQRAEFILANQYGISCEGCSFMNISRGVLTTGVARVSDGEVQGFDVRDDIKDMDGFGVVIGAIDGDELGGLDAKNADAFDILTGALKINSAVNVRNFNMLLGSNRIGYDRDGGFNVIRSIGGGLADDKNYTRYALDVGQFGNVKARNIYMSSSQRGVGVKVSGRMASSEGSIKFSADKREEAPLISN